MRRKLVLQGKSTLTLSLPKRWVDLNNIAPGDEVEIDEKDNQLSIRNINVQKPLQEINLSIDGSYNKLRSLLGGFYRGGYEKITLKFTDQKISKIIFEIVESLYGAEIYDVTPNTCVIRIFDQEQEEIPPHFNRMIHIIKTMIEMIIENKRDAAKEITLLRNKILRERDLISRLILKQKLLDNGHFPYYMLAGNLWNIARNYTHYYLAQESRKKQDPSTIQFFQKTNQLFHDFFTKLNQYTHEEIDKRYRQVMQEGEILICKKNSNPQLIAYCFAILMLIQSSNSHALLLTVAVSKHAGK